MWYIYEQNGNVEHRKDVRPAGKVIELERMPPKPIKEGFDSILNADFKTKRVWYDLVAIPPTLEQVKAAKIADIIAYDKSDAVNQFYLSTSPIWLDKSTRVGLMNSINIERAAGRVETNLWFNGTSFTFSIEQALGMLNALELYALKCYNTTQRHIAAINAMTTKEEIEVYDFSTDYPDKLTF